MLHAAPTSETKIETAQSKSQRMPTLEQRLHHDSFGTAGTYSLNGAGSAASVRSPEEVQQQMLAGMQRTHGNQAVLHMLHSPHQVARMSVLRPSQRVMMQRKRPCGGTPESTGECEECKAKHETTVQRSVGNQVASPAASTAPPIVHNVLNSSGQPLDAGTRTFMEPRFRHDFSQVRVHTDLKAAESAQAVNALAYTVGRDVVFGTGQYAPETSKGRKLMAHELTHVVQQDGNSRLLTASLAIGAPCDVFEQEAETTAERVVSGSSSGASLRTMRQRESEATLHRQQDTCPPDPQDEPLHPGTCPDIVRESGELEQFAAIGPSLETIAPVECFLIRNLRSGSTDFGMLMELNQIADQLRFDPAASLNIVGYSDCVGSATLNAALRWNRASEVADYFVGVLKVDSRRIVYDAAPATEYVDTNDTAVDRARNRSVAIGIVRPITPPPEPKPTPAPTTSDCQSWQTTMLTDHLNFARTWVNDAEPKVGAFRSGTASPAVASVVQQALTDNFHTTAPSDVATIADGFSSLKAALNQSLTFECEDEGCKDDAYVRGAFAFIRRLANIHVCPPWFHCKDYFYRVNVLIHERAHQYPGAGGEVYEYDAAYSTLPSSDALDNADSYSVAARQIYHGGMRGPGTTGRCSP